MRKSSLAGLAGLLLANACSLLFPVPDGSEAGDAGIVTANADGSTAPPDGRAGDDGGVPGVLCPEDARGPKLVPIDTYCIDRTPVTVAQYREFLNAGVPLDAMPPGCEAKLAYGFSPLLDGGSPAPDTPALVDWCEAHVYCRWAGKRVCGAVDGGALRYENPLEPDSSVDQDKPSVDDRQQNAWLHACTGPGGTVYPYGNDFEPDACVPGRSVGQPDCEGGYRGLFDFTSNREWVDSCNGKGCMQMDSPCRSYAQSLRIQTHDSAGGAAIRCCSP